MAKATSTIPDPIHAAIDRHRNAARLWEAAVNVPVPFPESADPMTIEERRQRDELDAVVAAARQYLVDAGLDLIETAPTTIGGIVAALECMRDQLLQDDGAFMPQDVVLDTADDATVVGWLNVFVDTLARAAADLVAQQQESKP
jgi:hypothetical protein